MPDQNFRKAYHNFKPVADKNSEILFLGSIPSVESNRQQFFYMHKTNRFWPVMSAVFGEDFCGMDKSQKIQTLLERHIALYDSIESCDILASSDNSIKNPVPADIPSIVSDSKIKRIFCVGAASKKYLLKFHPQYADTVTLLPSPSAANAAFSLERLTEIWKAEITPYIK